MLLLFVIFNLKKTTLRKGANENPSMSKKRGETFAVPPLIIRIGLNYSSQFSCVLRT